MCFFCGGLCRFLLVLPYASELLQFGIVGVILILARKLFLFLIPELIKMSSVVAATATALWATLVVVLDAVKAAIFVITDVVVSIDRFFHGHMKRPHVPDFLTPRVISAKEVRRELTLISETCQDYAGIGPIWNHIARDLFSPFVCPFLRATYPLGPTTVYASANKTLGWLSYNSEPYPGANCPAPAESPEWVCVGIGVGYILLELFLPLLIGGIFLYSAKSGVARILWLMWKAAVTTVELAADALFDLMSEI